MRAPQHLCGCSRCVSLWWVCSAGNCSCLKAVWNRSLSWVIWNRTNDLSGSQQDPPKTEPSRVAADEKQTEVDGETKWLYAAIDIDSKCILGVEVYSRHGTDPAAAFLHRIKQNHDVVDTEFLVDAMGYLTASARLNFRSHLDYNNRNYIEKWFHTMSMPIDRFHSVWMASSASAE